MREGERGRGRDRGWREGGREGREREEGRERQRWREGGVGVEANEREEWGGSSSSNLVFYAQSTSVVISGRYTF